MKFCPKDGHLVTPLKPEPWESRYRCDKCSTRYLIVAHDRQAGDFSPETIEIHHQPFTDEEVL